MTEPAYTDRALLYLLEEMPPEERTAFEAELEADPMLRHELRAAGDDLVRWVDDEIDPMPPPARVWGEIASALPGSQNTAAYSTEAANPFSTLRRWQAAAAILLLLNVFWFTSSMLRTEGTGEPREAVADQTHTHGSSSTEAEGDSADAALPSSVEDLQEALVAAREEAEQWESASGELSTQLSRASATNRALEDELRNWVSAATLARAEHASLERRIGSFFALSDGRANLTILELRPAGSPTSGIVNEVTNAIIEGDQPNILAGHDSTPINPTARPGSETGFQPGPVPVEDATAGDNLAGEAPPAQSAGSGDDGTSNPQLQNFADDSGAPNGSEADTGSEPAALAVWRSDQQQGFMNMYGLPENTEGAQYHLWAREAGGDYVAVGVLPDGSRGTVLLEFTVPQESFLPDSFLLTEEVSLDVNQPGEQVILTTPGGGE